MQVNAGRLDGRLAFLETELAITEAQQPLWQADAEAVPAGAAVKEQHHAAFAERWAQGR